MRKIIKILTISIFIIGIVSCASKSTAKNGESANLVILGTSDLHMQILNYNYFQDMDVQGIGLPYVSSMVKKIRTENKNVMLFDNGDIIQGNPFGDYFARVNPIKDGQTHPMIETMGLMKYDASGLGNHEFNYGYAYLQNIIKTSLFPFTNSNVIDNITKKEAFKPYLILEKEVITESGAKVKVKVGVIATVPTQITSWDKIALNGALSVNPAVKTVEKFVPQMRKEGADIVVVLSHAGIDVREYTDDMENTSYYITKIPGVDAVISGHAHKKFPQIASQKTPDFPDDSEGNIYGVDNKSGKINGVPIVMPSTLGDVIGMINLKIASKDGKWQVIDSSAHLEPMMVDGKEIVTPDPEIIAKVKPNDEKVKAYIRQPLGKVAMDVNSYFALVKNDMSVQIVNDAQRWFAKNKLKGTQYENLPILSAAAPFKAGYRGGYTNFPKGDITIRNTTDLYLYPNTIVIMKLKGREIKEWLEWTSGMFMSIVDGAEGENMILSESFPTYNFDIISGIQYQFDLTSPLKYTDNFELVTDTANRVVNMTYNGEPMDMDADFIVVTNNYRAGTNKLINKPGNAIMETADENRQAIIDYIKAMGTVGGELEQVWSFKPLGKPVVFRTSKDAKTILEADPSKYPNITFLRNDTDNPTEGKSFYKMEL